MHRILLKDGVKPTKKAQRRLNPPMMDVVKREILKLLEVGVIYPIFDSKWISPVQVVPKKSEVTVVKNDDNELVPPRCKPVGGYALTIENLTPPLGRTIFHYLSLPKCDILIIIWFLILHS